MTVKQDSAFSVAKLHKTIRLNEFFTGSGSSV
jgi:hypothetical protein